MDFRADEGINGAANQDAPAMRSLARLLVRAELARLDLEKELQAAVREVVQMNMRDAIRTVLDEMAGGIERPALPEQQGSAAATAGQAPAAVTEPGDSIWPACFSPEQDREAHLPRPLVQPAEPDPAGLYIYGVAAGEQEIELGAGIAGCQVYTIAVAGLSAVVHDCSSDPYRPDGDEQAKGWMFDHQEVLDRAKDMLGDILPMGFNTIIQAAGYRPPEALREWLAQENSRLKALLERLRGKEEFAVKVLVAEEVLRQAALRENDRLQELQQELDGKPEGVRYLYREKLEKAVKGALEDVAEVYFRKVYRTLSPLCADIQVEKTKRGLPGTRMVANLSCLVEKKRVPELGETLAEIERREGFSIDFTGPWPPYSFVGELVIPA